MKENTTNIKAHICMTVAIIFFAIISPVGKIVLDHIHPLTLNTLRFAGAAVCFWITSIFVREKVPKKDLFLLFFAAVFGTMLNQGLFIIGLSKTNPVHSSLMTSMAPLLTLTISAIYLKDKITFSRITGVIIGAFGASILIFMNKQTGDHPSSIGGDILCLCAQISYAIYLTFFLKLIKKYNPVTISKWLFTFSFICFFIISFRQIAADHIFTLPLDIWMRIFVIAILCTYVTYTLLMTAQKTLNPTIISAYNYFLPLIGAGISVAIGLGTVDYYTVLATVLILFGMIFVNKQKVSILSLL
jgi:drug/metabolite transporter (DMT)-like permease